MIKIYITIAPVVFGAVANMLFTKTALYKQNATPIDASRTFIDKKPIFGKNKTWIGFFSMVVFTAIMQMLWGFFCALPFMQNLNELYTNAQNTVYFNLLSGALLGFAYMLFELPNSFIKRRLSIEAGKTGKGAKGVVFFIVDRFDSVTGVAIALFALGAFSMQRAILYVLVGALTHISVNVVLLHLKVRDNL